MLHHKLIKNSYLFIWVGVFVLLLGGCSRKVDPAIINGGQTFNTGPHNNRAELRIDALGTAAFAIRYKDKLLLTDPFVSNPPAKQVMFKTIAADTSIVDQYYNRLGIEDTKIITVGHSHYDHLLDLPYLTSKLPANTTILGSSTTKNILACVDPVQSIVEVDKIMGTVNAPGTWVYSADSSIRVMPFKSDHLPHFMGIELYHGDIEEPLTDCPEKAKKWKTGLTITYLVDFYDGKQIAWRVFINSSSSKDDEGKFPASLLAEKDVDVTIGSVAMNSNDYIESVANICKPDVVFLAHWENFFKPKQQPYKGVSRTKVNKLYRELNENLEMPVILPEPGSTFLLR